MEHKGWRIVTEQTPGITGLTPPRTVVRAYPPGNHPPTATRWSTFWNEDTDQATAEAIAYIDTNPDSLWSTD